MAHDRPIQARLLAHSFFACLLLAMLEALSQRFGNSMLGVSLVWWRELAAFGMATLIVIGMAWVASKDGHLKMDQAGAVSSSLVWAGLLLVLFVLIAATFGPWAWRSFSYLETSANPSGLSFVWVLKILAMLAAFAIAPLWLLARFRGQKSGLM